MTFPQNISFLLVVSKNTISTLTFFFNLQLAVSAEPIDLSSLNSNPEFHLEDAYATTEGSRALAFSLILRRRPGPHLLRQVLPTFLVSGLSALCFLIPPASAERVTLAVGCLLALLLVFVAAGGGPKSNSAQLPLLGKYLTFSNFR